jgi:hypothetical protein
MTTLDELEAIRARHWVAGQYVTLALDAGQQAHADRATLLRLLDAARESVDRLEVALTVMSEAADQFDDWDDDDKKLFVALRLRDLRRARTVLAKDATPSPGAITGMREAADPCADCIDGWCQMNCGPRVA